MNAHESDEQRAQRRLRALKLITRPNVEATIEKLINDLQAHVDLIESEPIALRSPDHRPDITSRDFTSYDRYTLTLLRETLDKLND